MCLKKQQLPGSSLQDPTLSPLYVLTQEAVRVPSLSALHVQVPEGAYGGKEWGSSHGLGGMYTLTMHVPYGMPLAHRSGQCLGYVVLNWEPVQDELRLWG